MFAFGTLILLNEIADGTAGLVDDSPAGLPAANQLRAARAAAAILNARHLKPDVILTATPKDTTLTAELVMGELRKLPRELISDFPNLVSAADGRPPHVIIEQTTRVYTNMIVPRLLARETILLIAPSDTIGSLSTLLENLSLPESSSRTVPSHHPIVYTFARNLLPMRLTLPKRHHVRRAGSVG